MKVARTVWTYTKSIRIVRDSKPEVDKKALNDALKEAEAKVAADYTAESWAAFQTALADAKKMPETTQEEVNAKLAKVNEAMGKLVENPKPVLVKDVEGFQIVSLLGKNTISLPLVGMQAKFEGITKDSTVEVKLADGTVIELKFDEANNVFKSGQRDETEDVLKAGEITVK